MSDDNIPMPDDAKLSDDERDSSPVNKPIELEVEQDIMTDGPFIRLRIADTDDYIGWMRPDAAAKLHAALGAFLKQQPKDGE